MTTIETHCRAVLVCAVLTNLACKRAEPPAERQAVAEPSTAKDQAEGTAPKPAPVDPIMTADDFYFEWQTASGAVFLDQLSVDAKGRAVWLSPVSSPDGERVVHQLDATLDPAELEALRAAVVAAGFMDLDPSCGPDGGVADGNSLFVRVRANGELHRLACGESVPEALAAIRSAVTVIETDDRRSALEAAPVAPAGAFTL